MSGFSVCRQCGRSYPPDAEATRAGTDRCPACRGAGPENGTAQLAPDHDRGEQRPDDGASAEQPRPLWYFDWE